MDEDFSIHQSSTRPRKQPSQPSKTTAKSRDIKTILIEKETLQLLLVPRKNHFYGLIL